MSVKGVVVRAVAAGLGVAVLAACGSAEGSGGAAGGDLPVFEPTTAPSPAPSGRGELQDAGPGVTLSASASTSVGFGGYIGAGGAPVFTDPPPTVPADADPFLTKVSLRTPDVKHLGLRAEPDQDATSLEWPTVEICEAHEYPSEDERVARYQVTLVPRVERQHDGKDYDFGDPTLTSAVTRYDDAASAEQAMREWRASLADQDECTEDDALGALVPDLSFEELPDRRDAALPIADNSVSETRVRRTGKGEVARFYIVLQRHGDVVAELTYTAGDVYTYDELRELATVHGERIMRIAR